VNAFRKFKSAASSLGNLDADSAATLVAAAADMALVIDPDGLVQDIAFNSDDLAKDLAHSADWLGRPWVETVTIESRVKIEQLLKEAVSKAEPRWRHVNHPIPGRPVSSPLDVPVLYSAVQAGARGRVVAFGRDLRPIASLQQRLMDAQQSMERDYSRLQHVETRYRLLFETSAEAVMILDAATHKVVEANPAARQLYGEGVKRSIGRPFDELFEASGAARVQALLARVQTAGRGDEAAVSLAVGKRAVSLAASLFRQDNGAFFLVRLLAARGEADSATSKMGAKLLKILDKAPDGFVVTDAEGIVQTANAAFLEMIELGS
jgi:transcriptional regulator PpsR